MKPECAEMLQKLWITGQSLSVHYELHGYEDFKICQLFPVEFSTGLSKMHKCLIFCFPLHSFAIPALQISLLAVG